MRDGDYIIVNACPLAGWQGWYSIDHRNVHGEQIAYVRVQGESGVRTYADAHAIGYDGEGLA